MANPKVATVTLSEVVTLLHNAAKLKGIADIHVEELPVGIDPVKIGEEVVSHLEALPENDPVRRRIDLDKMRSGLDCYRKGTVLINRYQARDINEGDKIQVDYTK